MRNYKVVKNLSNNDLINSLIAEDNESGERFFIKEVNSVSEHHQIIKTVLKNSFSLQQDLKCDLFNISFSREIDNGSPYYLYPYLDESKWIPLTPKSVLDNPVEIISRLSLIIDYLHLLNYVHCDLKLSNFLINNSGKTPVLKLIDLDFLCKSESKPKGKIFGTPEHVPPEILNNEIILTQSDNFSIGVALNKCNEYLSKNDSDNKLLSNQLCNLVNILTDHNPVNRPLFLTDAFYNAGIMKEEKFDNCNRKLLSLLLLRSFKIFRSTKKTDLKSLIDDNKIYGLSDELIRDFKSAFLINRLKTLEVFKTFINSVVINRLNDYWHVQFDDDVLFKTYKSLSLINPDVSKLISADFDRVNEKTATTETYLHEQKRDFQKLYLILRKICDSKIIGEYDNNVKCDILEKTADFLIAQNRIEEAIKYLQLIEKSHDKASPKYLEIYHKIAKYNFQAGNEKSGSKMMNEGLNLSKENANLDSELKFLRLKAWYNGATSKIDIAFEILEKVLKISIENRLFESVVQTYYTYGVIFWSIGEFKKSKEYYMKSYVTAKENDLLDISISTIVSISSICKYLGEYDNVIKYGMLAIENIRKSTDMLRLPDIYLNIAFAYMYLGDFKKALDFQNKSLTPELSNYQSRQLVFYNHCNDVRLMNKGDYTKAKKAMYSTLQLLNSFTLVNIKGDIYQGLAEISFYEGRFDDCDNYLEKAKKILKPTNDKSSLLINNLWRILNTHFYKTTNQYSELLKLLKELLKSNNNYSAVLCFFFFIINNSDKEQIDTDVMDSINIITANSETPLYVVVSKLIKINLKKDNYNELKTYKECYKIFDETSSKFLSLICCRRIAELYLGTSKEKIASKFLKRALFISKSINNEILSQELSNEIKAIESKSDYQSKIIESLYGLSTIIKHVDDYDTALNEVVKYAINQTGAERGVLLKKTNISTNFQIEAYVNCDEDSLDDIKDFSKSIPMSVDIDQLPLIIENAKVDKRTKDYKSIFIHNILSVICVPIDISENESGVLYLDHHTIPALFSKDDILYVKSIANMLGVILTSIKSYKNINIINKQLIEDIKFHGDIDNFITDDPKTKDLLNGLPEMAKSDFPFLIMGESGTGKEILTHMIHELSTRNNKPLVKLNCAAIAGTLIESELFGVKGKVATGVDAREGKFSAADGGSFFLDEIGDLPLDIQAKVLRVIENGEFFKVGSNKLSYTDVRYISATNKNLKKMMQDHSFREDLFYRIQKIYIEISPLRKRPCDIILLINHFIKKYDCDLNSSIFTPEAVNAFTYYDWPGNVRELRNVIERSLLFYKGEKIDLSSLPIEIREFNPKSNDKKVCETIEKTRIVNALKNSNWNISRAAIEFGKPRTTFIRLMKKYNIKKDQ